MWGERNQENDLVDEYTILTLVNQKEKHNIDH